MKFCPHCGNAIKNDLAKYCGKCGTKQPEIAPVTEPVQDPETLSVEDEDFVEAGQPSVATPPPFFESEEMSTPPPIPAELLALAESASQDMSEDTELGLEEYTYSPAQYERKKKLSSGAIVGIILGVLVAIIFIIVMIVYIKNNYGDDYSHDSDLYSVIDSVAVDSVATYTYEEVDREREREQIAERRIHDRLQEHYTGLSNYPGPPVDNILSKDLRKLLDRVYGVAEQYETIFLDVDIWTDAQDNGNLTVLPFDSFTLDGDMAYVTVTIVDSMFGDINKKFELVYEYGDWFVNDIISMDDGSSLRSYAETFIADPEAWW